MLLGAVTFLLDINNAQSTQKPERLGQMQTALRQSREADGDCWFDVQRPNYPAADYITNDIELLFPFLTHALFKLNRARLWLTWKGHLK